MQFIKIAVAAATLAALCSANASTVNVDFSGYAHGTALTSLNGVNFSLVGGQDAGGAPTIDAFDDNGLLTNTRYAGDYPTANILKFTFDQAVTDVSFTFDNEGYSDSGRGHSSFTAFDASGNVLDTMYDTTGSFTTYSFGDTTGIKSIEFNNGTGGTDSWWFGVHSLSAVTAVPEPTDAALFLAGLGLVAAAARRKSKA